MANCNKPVKLALGIPGIMTHSPCRRKAGHRGECSLSPKTLLYKGRRNGNKYWEYSPDSNPFRRHYRVVIKEA